jgi:hypothetical protein
LSFIEVLPHGAQTLDKSYRKTTNNHSYQYPTLTDPQSTRIGEGGAPGKSLFGANG